MEGPALPLSDLTDGCSVVPKGIGTRDPSLEGVREAPRGRVWWWWVGPCDGGQCPLQTSASPLVSRSQTTPEAVVCERPGQPVHGSHQSLGAGKVHGETVVWERPGLPVWGQKCLVAWSSPICDCCPPSDACLERGPGCCQGLVRRCP